MIEHIVIIGMPSDFDHVYEMEPSYCHMNRGNRESLQKLIVKQTSNLGLLHLDYSESRELTAFL